MGRIHILCDTIINYAVNEKKKTGKESDKESEHLPVELHTIASHIVDDVDDKTRDELTSIFIPRKMVTGRLS